MGAMRLEGITYQNNIFNPQKRHSKLVLSINCSTFLGFAILLNRYDYISHFVPIFEILVGHGNMFRASDFYNSYHAIL